MNDEKQLIKEQPELEEVQRETSNENTENDFETKSKQYDELKARYIRLLADFDNFKKRTSKERLEFYNSALEDIVVQLLPVLDDFERALDSTGNSDTGSGFLEGFEMIFRQLKDVLGKFGLSEIDVLGKPFDPYYSEAVMKEPSQEHEENTITEVFKKGYKLNDKVIRPSIVKVSG